MNPYNNIDEYIANFPYNVQKILTSIREHIANQVPEAIECINYGIPTFKLNNKNLVHFAAYKTHIGFYPGAETIKHYVNDLNKFTTSKGTIQFPINDPIPLNLITNIINFRINKIQTTNKYLEHL